MAPVWPAFVAAVGRLRHRGGAPATQSPLRRPSALQNVQVLRVADDPHIALASSPGLVVTGAISRSRAMSRSASSLASIRDSSDAGIAASSTAGTNRPRRLVQNRLVANTVDPPPPPPTTVRPG